MGVGMGVGVGSGAAGWDGKRYRFLIKILSKSNDFDCPGWPGVAGLSKTMPHSLPDSLGMATMYWCIRWRRTVHAFCHALMGMLQPSGELRGHLWIRGVYTLTRRSIMLDRATGILCFFCRPQRSLIYCRHARGVHRILGFSAARRKA